MHQHQQYLVPQQKRDLKDNPFLLNTLILLVLTQMDTGLANQVNVQIEDVNDCLQVSAVS